MQSMTGYGRGLICEDGREMTVEVKSVNHRFLDVSFRLEMCIRDSSTTAESIMATSCSNPMIAARPE